MKLLQTDSHFHAGDRRRFPRIDAADRLLAATTTGMRLHVLNLSYEGCLVAGAAPLAVGSMQQFQLDTVDGSVSVIVTGRVIHTRLDSPSTPDTAYLTGLRLVGPRSLEAGAAFDSLMDLLTMSLTAFH